MKARPWEKRRFTGRRSIRTSLTVAAWVIMAAAIVVGLCLAPSLAAETQKPQKPIKLGLFGVTSGSGGIAGETIRHGVEMWVDEVNVRGGLLGRKVEFVQRDTGGKPEEAVRWAREFAGAGDIDFLYAHGSSAEGFAVASVSKESRSSLLWLTMPRTLRRIQKSGVLTVSEWRAITYLTISCRPSMPQRSRRNSVLNGGTR